MKTEGTFITNLFALDEAPKAEGPVPSGKNNCLSMAANGWREYEGALRERDAAAKSALKAVGKELDDCRRDTVLLVRKELLVAHLREPERQRRQVMAHLMADEPSPSNETH